ncbi:MAG: flavodoxin family protein [Clostridia bacterium]|jgi:multimeric flavodoxin WrbA|nr:flavodoxin family protein [Clostridia bacterium]MCI2015228.1 flavodoxin family protein [Clostridia bacterium]
MSKKILVVSTSLRSKSNSEALADAFIKGARESGNSVEKITLKDKRIAFCTGCLACQELQKCVIADDAVEIVRKMHDAETIIFATPIYYYEMSGQMKVLLDRSNPLYPSDYAFRDIYLLTTAAEDESYVPEKAISGLKGWINCFSNASFAGSVFAGGVNNMGEIEGHVALSEAYELGKSIF